MRSFQQTLQHNLSAAVISAGLDAEGSKVPRTSTYYRSSATSLVYRSAIALSLSARSGLSPLQVAQVLVASLPDEFDSDGLGVRVLSSGWIEFVPSDGAIAFWLQEILSSVEGTGGDGEMGRGGDGESGGAGERGSGRWGEREMGRAGDGGRGRAGEILGVQYVHARCCSLLRSAHRDGLVRLDCSEETPPPWQWLEPNPVPWLTPIPGSSSKTAILRFNRPAEGQLIVRVSEAADVLSDPSPGDKGKVAWRICEALLEFERDCRIWGEVKVDAPELARSRLGLVAIAQILLAQLLQQSGVQPWVEL